MSTSEIRADGRKLPPYGLIVLVFILIEATGVFEQVMIYTALPTLMEVFALDAVGISWSITIFLLVGAGTVAISGRLGDLFGRKRVLIALMIISAIGSLVSVVFGSWEGIMIGRALQGTSAAIFPLLAGVAREVVPAPRVPVLISIATGTATLAGALAGFVAGILIDAGDWRHMFVASGALAIVALVLAIFVFPPSILAPERERRRFDVLGTILLAPGVAALLFGFTTLRGGLSPISVGCLVGGAVILAIWLIVELTVKHPMFNLRLFKNRSLTATLVTTALVSIGTFGGVALITPILQQSPTDLPIGLGMTPTIAGTWGLLTGVVGFGLSPLAGRIAAKTGARNTVLIGVGLGIVGTTMLGLSAQNMPLSIAAIVVGGVAAAFLLAGLPNLIVEVVPAENTGESVGLVYGVGRTLFTAIGTTVVGLLLTIETVPQTTAPTLTTWWIVICYVLATLVLAGVSVLFTRRIKPMDQRGQVVEATAEAEAQDAEADDESLTEGQRNR